MKKSLQFVLFTIFALGLTTLSANIPELAKQQFAELYPLAEVPYWEKGSNGYVASFRSPAGLKRAYFDEQGSWQESSLKLVTTRMPAGVVRNLQQHHDKVSEISYGVGYNRSKEWYWAELVYADRVVLQRFDESGNLKEEKTVLFSTGGKHGSIGVVLPYPQQVPNSIRPASQLSGLEWFAFDLKKHREFMDKFSVPNVSDYLRNQRSGKDLSTALRRINIPFQNVDYPFIIRFQI